MKNLRGKWIAALALSVICLVGLGEAKSQVPKLTEILSGKQIFVDRMHGFSVQLPPFWSAKVIGNAILIKDDGLHFIIVRGARYDGNIKQVAQKWLQEREATSRLAAQFTGSIPRFVFKQTQQGIVIYGDSHPIAPTQSCYLGVEMTLAQTPEKEFEKAAYSAVSMPI